MRLGLYIFAALTLIAIVGAFAYTINPNHYIVELMGINFNFPIAVWLILPMLLLLLLTIFHMLFYSLKSYFKLRKWQKDARALDDSLYWSLVNEPKNQKYAVEEIATSAALLSKSVINISDNIEGLNPRLSKTLNIINKIKNGEYVDLKEHKMTKVFNDGNPHLIQNRLNRLESSEEFVEEVLKSSAKFSDIVQGQALKIFAQKSTFYKAKKYTKLFDTQNFFTMLARVDSEDEMEITADILSSFVSELKFSCRDFVKIASITKKQFSPDENLALFRKYQRDNTKAQNAYLYLLFEYELLDDVSAYLEEHEEGEFVKFRALNELKKQHKAYRLEDIVDPDTIC